jgi:predicted RNase H-like nuclease/predicted enzyme related to lactoylglutathione lyase
MPSVGNSRLVFVALRVREVEASARLYRDAFGVPFREGQPPEQHAEVSWSEGAYLHLALFPADEGPPGTNPQIGFFVDDVEAAHVRAAAAGAAVVYPPRDESWGRTAAYRDLDGTLVTLTQPGRPLRVAGVDIAGRGWAVVVLEGDEVVEAYRCERFAQALRTDVEVIAVDVPIGIPESGVRPADEAARRFIGSRGSSVFSTPIRAVLETPTYEKARERALELTGKSVPKQAYSLARYILEVDEYAHDDARVIEVHPEVSFFELGHRPLPPKRRTDGWAERRRLLEEAGIDVPAVAQRVREPDLLDATIAAWSARRYALGQALPLPDGHVERIGAIWR